MRRSSPGGGWRFRINSRSARLLGSGTAAHPTALRAKAKSSRGPRVQSPHLFCSRSVPPHNPLSLDALHSTLPNAPSEEASATHLSPPWTLSLTRSVLQKCPALNIKTGVTIYRLELSSGSWEKRPRERKPSALREPRRRQGLASAASPDLQGGFPRLTIDEGWILSQFWKQESTQ